MCCDPPPPVRPRRLPPATSRETTSPRLPFCVTGIMQPVKNGRTDMPPGVALLEGPGGGDGQLQVRPPRPEASYGCLEHAHCARRSAPMHPCTSLNASCL